MKKIITILLAIVLCFCVSLTAYAEEQAVEQDASQPRFMVSDYKVEGGSVTPSKTAVITINLKNYSSKKAISNIKLSLLDESGEIIPEGTGTQFVSKIYAGSTYTWKIKVKASSTAAVGQHNLTVASEYEDKYYSAYSGSDVILVNVKQKTSLNYDGIILPKKVIQDETTSMDVTLMNTGKSNIRNAKITFDIDSLQSGGVLFIGEIPAGESSSGSANFQIDRNKLGEVKGTATLTYEDEFGKEYTKTIALSTTIEKKPEKADTKKEEEKKNPLWWLFLIIGIVVGGGIGCSIPIMIYKNKQRKIDEMRL